MQSVTINYDNEELQVMVNGKTEQTISLSNLVPNEPLVVAIPFVQTPEESEDEFDLDAEEEQLGLFDVELEEEPELEEEESEEEESEEEEVVQQILGNLITITETDNSVTIRIGL
jgi:hypothetical protein